MKANPPLASSSRRRPLALVTGASTGIGRALALHHAHRGGDVIVTARRAPLLEKLCAEVVALGGAAHAIAADLAQEGAARALVDEISAQFGDVDMLMNNAGIGGLGRFCVAPA